MVDKIDTGHEVIIYFAHHEPIRGVVLGLPMATGDSWKIRRGDGRLIYVQQFDYMELA